MTYVSRLPHSPSTTTGVVRARSSLLSKCRAVFLESKEGRLNMQKFLENIFMQIQPRTFVTSIFHISCKDHIPDERLYSMIVQEAEKASGNGLLRQLKGFEALHHLQDDLSSQIASLLGHGRTIEGYMEIGYPGRMIPSMKRNFTMQGPIYVVNDAERITDYIQCGFPRPYDKFLALEDFVAIGSTKVQDGTLDVVACFVGLHHISGIRVMPFLKAIYRCLRPGGFFILMEHDAHNVQLQTLVDVVHTVFNAATHVPYIEEAREIRNFCSLQHWIRVVQMCGLKLKSHRPLIRDGDPTLNSLIFFEKEALSLDEIEASLEKSPGYVQDLSQTYLTAPEWYNVRITKAYAEFITHTPFFKFAFLNAVLEFWRIFARSWNAARKRCSLLEVALSEFTLMNLFIGITMTAEFLAKSLISIPVNLMYGRQIPQDKTLQVLVDTRGRNLHVIDTRIEITGTFSSSLKTIKIPKYFPFTDIIQKLTDAGMICINIAGQKIIQLDLTGPIERLQWPHCFHNLACKKLYSMPSPMQPELCIVTIEAWVDRLHCTLPLLQKRGWSIDLMHDF